MQATSPAKIILFGEHAVVYGKPAIAIPISSLRVTASVQPTASGYGLEVIAADLGEQFQLQDKKTLSSENALELTTRLVLEHLQAPIPDAIINIRSEIPIASGLGSGAAVSAALARAVGLALDQPLQKQILNEIVYQVEKIHHGTPSGIDNTVIVYEQPIYFVRGQPIKTIPITKPFSLLIGDSGKGALTRIAVGDVRKLYDADPLRIQPLLDEIGQIAVQARQAIENGDIADLGPLMNQNHALLQQLTVSSDELDHLVQAARDAGAWGAKLSGGGRGGNMIALVTSETAPLVRENLLKAGAVRVVETTVS